MGERDKTILKAIADGRIHASSLKKWERAWEKNPKATAALLAELEPVPALIDEAINDGRLAAFTRAEWFEHWKEDPKATEARIKSVKPGTNLAPGPTEKVLSALGASGQGSDGLPDEWFRSPQLRASGRARARAGGAGTSEPPPSKAPPPTSPPAAKGQAAEPLDWPELRRANPARRGRVTMDQSYGRD